MGFGHGSCQTADRHLFVKTDRYAEDGICSFRVICVFRIVLYPIDLDPLIMGTAELNPCLRLTFRENDFRAGDLHLTGAARNSKFGGHIAAVFRRISCPPVCFFAFGSNRR